MKKTIGIILTAILLMGSFAGCSTTADNTTSGSSSSDLSSEAVSSITSSSNTSSSEALSNSVSSENTSSLLSTSITSSKIITSTKTSSASSKTETTTATLKGTIRLSGSTSVYPLAQQLREAFLKKPEYKNIKIEFVNITGSGSGVLDAQKKIVTFGMSSRDLTAAEKQVLNFQNIAQDGVAVIVNKNNPLDNVTKAQLNILYPKDNAFSGNWKTQFNINYDHPIATYTRESNSGTRDCFQSVLGIKPHKATNEYTSTGALKQAVAGNENAIGYISLGALDNSVKALKYENITANEANVINGTYAFKRNFVFCYNKSTTLSAEAKAFLDYILSAEGQTIADKDYIKLP